MKKQRIGFIGLGLMGGNMAKNLLKNGYEITGYNRSKKALFELEKLGLKIVKTPKDVALQSEVVILMLPSSVETNDVIFAKNGLIEGLKKGQIVIDMSTSNPVETKKIFKKLTKKGIIMLDAPVSRGQKAAVNGTLSIMVGGDKKSYEKCLPIFKSMGTYITHLGPFGSGMYVKALNNFLFAMNLLASSQGLMIMKKNKIDIRKAVELISESSGDNSAISVAIKNRLEEKHPSINFFLKYMSKDMNIFNSVVKNQKTENALAQPVADYFNNAIKKFGDKDAMYIYENLILKGKK